MSDNTALKKMRVRVDISSGLMIFFSFMMVATLRTANENKQEAIDQKEEIEQVVENLVGVRSQIYDDLKKEFSEDLPIWNAEIDPDLILRFNEPDLLFGAGRSNVKREFRKILDDFWPRYLAILQKYDGHISEIQIEGHTDRDGRRKNSTERESYIYNMDLSHKRATATLKYCMDISLKEKDSFIIEKVSANGKSFSKERRDKDGNVSKSLSRRVEFSIKTNDREAIEIINKM